MATLKELIGEGYNENLSHAEIDNLLKDRKFADLATGNYVSFGKYKALEDEKSISQNLRTRKSERLKSQNVKSILRNLREQTISTSMQNHFLTLLTKKQDLKSQNFWLTERLWMQPRSRANIKQITKHNSVKQSSKSCCQAILHRPPLITRELLQKSSLLKWSIVKE